MPRPRGFAAALAAAMLVAGALVPAAAQQTTWHGQIRPRFESRDPSFGGGADSFTSMRTRFALDVDVNPELTFYVEAQDVRIWGEESHPLFDFSADNLDLHQAYFRYAGSEVDWLTTSVGRMETRFGGERLVGAVDWQQQGQTFDGVRLDLDGEPGSLAVIAYTIADESAAPATENRHLFGAYGTAADVGPGALDLYWLYARARDLADTDEHSVGGRYVMTRGQVEGRFEATYQTGTRVGTDVSAFMVGARLGTSIADERGRATLWYDYLSGNDPATPEVETFNTLYGTNHKFYGYADLFTNIPVHTGGAGLQDLSVKLAFDLRDDLSAGIDLHHFRAAQQGGLSQAHLADEIDLTLTRRYSENLGVIAGFSFVFQSDPLAEIGRLGEDQSWLYLMFDASF